MLSTSKFFCVRLRMLIRAERSVHVIKPPGKASLDHDFQLSTELKRTKVKNWTGRYLKTQFCSDAVVGASISRLITSHCFPKKNNGYNYYGKVLQA